MRLSSKGGEDTRRRRTSTNLTVIMKASSGSGQSSCRAVWLIWAKQVDRSTADVLCLVSSPRGTSWGMGEGAERAAQALPDPCPSLPPSFHRHSELLPAASRGGQGATRGRIKAPPRPAGCKDQSVKESHS